MYNEENLRKALKELDSFKKKKKLNYYNYDWAVTHYDYDVFFNHSTRSAGKTTATQRDIALRPFLEDGVQFIKVCRWKDKMKNIHQSGWWTDIVEDTLHKYDVGIEYQSGVYYINEREKYLVDGELKKRDFIKEGTVIGRVVPVMSQQDFKSTNYSKVANIIFDEYALKNEYGYPSDEIENWTELLSTIVRLRPNVKVYFVGNIYGGFNPYFNYYGIDPYKLTAGNTYTFSIDGYKEGCKILFEYGEPVTTDPEQIPRLMRTPNNEQVTGGLTEFTIPQNIVQEDDWLVNILERKDKKRFREFYDLDCVLVMSTDNSRTLRRSGSGYSFESIEIVLIKDWTNKKCYFIRNNAKDWDNYYGIYLTEGLAEVKRYKFLDSDIRNQLPFYDEKELNGWTIIYGDTNLYDILRERGWKL